MKRNAVYWNPKRDSSGGIVNIERLSKAIRLKTIFRNDCTDYELQPFLDFHALLENSYPLIRQTLEKKVINTYSLLYKWPGKNPKLDPIAFLAHFDVVPVEPGTQQQWRYDPFSGAIADGFVWGRGALDMKGPLMAMMEAVETLLSQGVRPERTIYLALGHDEESGGFNGAKKIAFFLKNRGIRFLYTLDEGMAVLDQKLSPIKQPIAVIGIAEKGYLTLKLSVKDKGGHPSVAPFKTAIGTLCRAVRRLERKPMPAAFVKPSYSFFEHISLYLPLWAKTVLKNSSIFNWLILFMLGRYEKTNAMIRTIGVPTMIQSGVRENILPCSATALINYRILPGDSIKKVVRHVTKAIDNDVKIEICDGIICEPSPVSDKQSKGYLSLAKAIGRVFPDTAISAGLVLGTTDSRYYSDISRNNYRFAPFVFGPQDRLRIHGTNERVPIKGYVRAIEFYMQVIKKAP